MPVSQNHTHAIWRSTFIIFLTTEVKFACLRIDGDSDWYIESVKLEWKKSVKILVFSLMILDGISDSWQTFDASRFKILFVISSLSKRLEENWGVFLHNFAMVSIVLWLLYFTIAFNTGFWILYANESQLL